MASETDDQYPQGLTPAGRGVRSESTMAALGGAGDAPLRFQRQGLAEVGNVLGNGMVPAGGGTVLLSSIRAVCKTAPGAGGCTIDIQGWGPGYAGAEDASIFSSGIITIPSGVKFWDPAVDPVVLDGTNKVFANNGVIRAKIILANGAQDVTLILGFSA